MHSSLDPNVKRKMDEIDIWRSAYLLIKQQGDGAELAAAKRVDDMIARGDSAGEVTWKRIFAAIIALRRSAPMN